MGEEHLTLTTEEVTAFAKEAVQRFVKQYEEGAGGCVMEVEDAQLFAGLLKGLLNHVDDQAERVEELEAQSAERKKMAQALSNIDGVRNLVIKTRNDALREALQGCNMILATDQCGSGTEYDKGFKAAAQQCVDVVESHIEGDKP